MERMAWITDLSEWIAHEITAFGVRWLVWGAIVMLGMLLFGRGYKKRIAALEAKSQSPSIVLHKGATYNRVEGELHIHHHINGPVEIVQPKPPVGRVIPLEVEFKEGVVIAESHDAKLIGPDGEVKGHWRNEQS